MRAETRNLVRCFIFALWLALLAYGVYMGIASGYYDAALKALLG